MSADQPERFPSPEQDRRLKIAVFMAPTPQSRTGYMRRCQRLNPLFAGFSVTRQSALPSVLRPGIPGGCEGWSNPEDAPRDLARNGTGTTIRSWLSR